MSRRRDALFAAIYLVVSCYVLIIALRDPGVNGHHRSKLGDMVYGEAHSPYVQRALVPLVVRGVSAVTPESAHAYASRIADRGSRSIASRIFRAFHFDEEFAFESALTVLIMLASLLGFGWALHRLFVTSYESSWSGERIWLLVALLALPIFFKHQNYIYDFPQLFLYSLGLWLMARHRWPAYLAVFALGCLNKETTVFLCLVFAIQNLRQRRTRKTVGLLIAQLALFAVIKTLLSLTFANNPGGVIEPQLFFNLSALTSYSLATILAWGAVAWMVFAGWHRKPSFARATLSPVVPMMILAALFGIWNELRIYYEIYPAVLLLAYPTVARASGARCEALDSPVA